MEPSEQQTIVLTLWEIHALLVCVNAQLPYTRNAAICPQGHRQKLLELKRKLNEQLPPELREEEEG